MDNLNIKKIGIQAIIFLIFLSGMVSMLFKGQDLRQILEIVKLAVPKYLVFGMIMSLIFMSLDALNIKILLNTLSYKATFKRTIKYTCNGLFFSAITPGASGGQPMQIYAMKKDGIEIAHGSIILLIQLACYQFVIVSIGTVALFLMWGLLTIRWIKLLAITGVIVNSLLCMILLFSILSSVFVKKIHLIGNWIIDKFFSREEKRILLRNKLQIQVKEYHQCSKLIKESKSVIVRILLITVLQVSCLFAIPYFVYRALGGEIASLREIFLLQGVIQITTSFIPVPGGVGISEGLFLNVFKGIYSIKKIRSGMLLSRGISFYLVLISAGIILGYKQMKSIVCNINLKRN